MAGLGGEYESPSEDEEGFDEDGSRWYPGQLVFLGVMLEENAWTLAGYIDNTDEEFLVRAVLCELPPPEGKVAIWSGRELFSVRVIIESRVSDRTVFDLCNGVDYCDEDGDFDYSAAGMPVAVWRYIYGRILAPVQVSDDVDP